MNLHHSVPRCPIHKIVKLQRFAYVDATLTHVTAIPTGTYFCYRCEEEHERLEQAKLDLLWGRKR